MTRTPVVVEFTWSEAANLLVAAKQVDTTGWTNASKGNLQRACEKLAANVPTEDRNAFFLIVRGQTAVAREP